MKFNSNLMNEEKRNALRTALIQRIDAALDAKEPDMETVDLCTKLLDALEQGSCQPSGRRMRRELARLAQEIDYVPQAHALVQTKPMTVRRALVGAAAVFMCLLLLPIAVILLRGGSQGLTGQESAETSPAAAETAEPAVTEGVAFRRGDRTAQYDSLAACLDQEMPELYYPTVFPDGMKPTSVTVTEEGEEVCTTIGLGDTPYSISVFPWFSEKNTAAKESGYEKGVLINWIDDASFLMMEANGAYEDDVYRLSVHIDSLVYEFRAADDASAYAILESLHRADTDHIHAWEAYIIEIPSEEDPLASERHVWKECSICGTVESTLPPDFEPTWKKSAETDHVHEWENIMVTVEENGKQRQKVQRICHLCEEIQAETTLEPYFDINGYLQGNPQ